MAKKYVSKKRKRRLDVTRKLSKLAPPLHIERDYQTRIRAIVTRVKEIIDQNIVRLLPTIMAEVESMRPADEQIDKYWSEINGIWRLDQTIGEKVADLFKSTRIQVGSEITQFEIEGMVQGKATQISNWNKAQITAVIKQGLGIDLFISEPFLAEELQAWTTSNVNLINSNNAAFLAQTEQTVFEGMRRGLRHEEIAKQILGTSKDELGRVSRFRFAKTRANLIGRDQTNKLNGVLNRLRQTSIGVKKYIWITVGDPRVRDRHAAWDGDIVDWKRGKDGGIHPGDEIQCRCWPEPILDDLLE